MNTLKVAKQLQEAGCDSKIAEAISLSISEAIDSKAATKADLLEVKIELQKDFNSFKTDMNELKTTFYKWQIGLMILIASAFIGQTYLLIDIMKSFLNK